MRAISRRIGIEAGEDDRFRRVVDDEVDAGGQLQRADVASFAADDAALHVFAGEVDDGDRVLGDVVGGHALDGHAEDLAGLEVAELVGLGLDALDDAAPRRAWPRSRCRGSARAWLPRSVRPETCSSLWRCASISSPSSPSRCLQRLLAVADGAVALLDLGHARVELLRLLVEVLFLLLQAPLADLQLVVALLRLAVEVRPHLQKFFFGLEVGFLGLATRRPCGRPRGCGRRSGALRRAARRHVCGKRRPRWRRGRLPRPAR